jgi:hypothetical protein
MSWGYKILFVYIAFVSGILFMVFRSSSQKFDLVTADYYAKELKFQDRIDEMKRVSALSAPLVCEIKTDSLLIRFPQDFSGYELKGEATLYCPSDESRDIKQQFDLKDKSLVILLNSVKRGMYELHLDWTDGRERFYFEKKLFIE